MWQLRIAPTRVRATASFAQVRNQNSSRFGKHFDIQVNRETGEILGAYTSVYLLEKPRIYSHAAGERNYHIFYMLLQVRAPARRSNPLRRLQAVRHLLRTRIR